MNVDLGGLTFDKHNETHLTKNVEDNEFSMKSRIAEGNAKNGVLICPTCSQILRTEGFLCCKSPLPCEYCARRLQAELDGERYTVTKTNKKYNDGKRRDKRRRSYKSSGKLKFEQLIEQEDEERTTNKEWPQNPTADLKNEIEQLEAEERRIEMEKKRKDLLAKKEQREKEKKEKEAEEQKLKELYKTLTEKYKKEFPRGTPLVCACEKGCVEDVEGMIRGARAAGMDVTAMVSEVGTSSNGSSHTPLIAAAFCEHSTIIEILLQCNADTATTDDYGANALHIAAGNNNKTTTIVQLLLNNMKLEDINNHKTRHGKTPLDHCYNYNKSFIKQQLIDLIRQKGGKEKRELAAEAEIKRIRLLSEKELKELYKTLTEKYKKEFPKGTPLICACEKGRVEDVEGMIRGARAAGMDVTAMVSEVGTSSNGGGNGTPLMAAACYEHSTIIEILLQCNADTATTDDYGANALHYACTNKTTTTIVQLLLNNMKLEDINNHKTRHGKTPLDLCYNYNKSSIKQQLIDLIRQKGGKEKRELAAEAEIKRIRLLSEKELKELYKTLTEKYKKEFPKGTPLICACEKGRVEDVEGMIRGARAAGMDVTAMVSEVGTDSYGYISSTPLMVAALFEHSTIIEILLQCNADTATTTNFGSNALHTAAEYNKTTTTTVQLLLNNMKLEDINRINTDGNTPLDRCYCTNSSIKQQLIDLIRQKGGKRESEL